MVLDGGGQSNSAGIDGLHTLSLLLASLVPHDHATEDTHKHTGKEHKSTWTNKRTCTLTLNVGTVHKSIDREVITPSPCE